MLLPEAVAEEVRRIARQAALQVVEGLAFTRAEMLDMVADLTPPLKPEDAAVLKILLPWLAHHRRGTQVLAAEIVALMLADQAGGEVRTALAAELQSPHPAKALGRLLRRCAWRPVDGFYVKVTPPSHRRESALFTCEACT